MCVLSTCTGGSSTLGSGGTGATTTSSGGNGPQNVTDSIGSAQVGSVVVNPAVGGNAPITGNVPVCVLTTCAGGGSTPTTTTTGGGEPQTATGSLGAVPAGCCWPPAWSGSGSQCG